MRIAKVRGVSKRALQWYFKYYFVPSVTKTFTLEGVQISIVQYLERWIVYTPLCINVFVTLATQ
jgi:hypothetical protein